MADEVVSGPAGTPASSSGAGAEQTEDEPSGNDGNDGQQGAGNESAPTPASGAVGASNQPQTGHVIVRLTTEKVPAHSLARGIVRLSSGGAAVGTKETDRVGRCEFDVVKGSYRVELLRPPPYFVAGAAPADATVDPAAGEPTYADVAVTPLTLTVTAEGLDDGAGPCEAEVRSDQGVIVGRIRFGGGLPGTIDLPESGTYVLTQVAAPDGVTLPPTGKASTVHVNGPRAWALKQKKLQVAVDFKLGDTAKAGGRVRLSPTGDGSPGHEGPAGTMPVLRAGPHIVEVLEAPPDTVATATTFPVDVDFDAAAAATVSIPVVAAVANPKAGRAFWASWIIVGVAVVVFVGSLLRWLDLDRAKPSAGSASWAGLAAGAAVLAVAFLLLTLGGIKSRLGLFGAIVGADGRASTSRFAPALWSLSLAFAVVYNAARVGWDGDALEDTLKDRWDDYLILLGGPFAAAVLAKGFVSWRVENGTLQKTETATGATAGDLVEDDSRRTSLVDSQYLLFNIVALAVFWVGWLENPPNLPLISPLLLALTSGSAALYVANKAVEQNKPVITGVAPASARAGEEVTIGGQHFVPPGTKAAAGVTVTLEGFGSLQTIGQPSDTQVKVRVPSNAPVGLRNLRVTTAARVTTDVWLLEIVDATPAVLNVLEGSIVPGDVVHVVGRHLAAPPGTAASPPLVGFGTRWMPAEMSTLGGSPVLKSTAPRDLDGPTVTLSARTGDGRTATSADVAVQTRPEILGGHAWLIEDPSRLVIELDVRNVLEAAYQPGLPTKARIAVDGAEVDVGDGTAIVSGSRDRLRTAVAEFSDDADRVTVTVKDHRGRLSAQHVLVIGTG